MALPKLNAVMYDLELPYSKRKIQYRPFVVGEQKQLMIAMETKDDKQIMTTMKQAITACTNNTVEVGTLPLFELEYLFLNIRMKSVGEKTKIILECGTCQAQNAVDVDLRDTEFVEKKKVDDIIFLTDTVALKMNIPSMDILNKTQKDKLTTAEQVFELTAACVASILDKEDEYVIDDSNRKELYEFIDSLSTDQFTKIQEWFDNMPSLKLHIKHVCDNCKSNMDTEMQGISNFF
jgi:hypothetical protein